MRDLYIKGIGMRSSILRGKGSLAIQKLSLDILGRQIARLNGRNFDLPIVYSALIFFLLDQWRDHAWDPLLISGIGALILGIHLSQGIPKKMKKNLMRLVNRKALNLTVETLEDFQTRIGNRAARWAHRGGLLVAISMLMALLYAFSKAFKQVPPAVKLPLMLFETLGGYIAGRYLGRMASYGRLGWILKKEKISLMLEPGHLDGAVGLKPIGDFYFYQAMVAAIPAIFLGAWWLGITFMAYHRYQDWRRPYLGLLVIALAFEILAFLVPLWSFHREMQKQKIDFLKNADKLSRKIAEIQVQLAGPMSAEQRNVLKDQVAYMTKQYWDIEQMPTWPVDVRTRRYFTLNNIVLSLPLITKFIGGTDTWRHISELVGGVVSILSKQ